ncbi:MAG: hypothetical protein Q7U04_14415 [Bacteriovorax sp.]|nr:hypothetical protein [Bacteriovorax sp.]
MKILLALVLSLSAITLSAAVREPTASQKLLSYLPLGFHSGQNDLGEECSVFVNEVNYPKRDVQVSVMVKKTNLTKLIEEDSRFGYKDYKKEFVQTERSVIGTDSNSYVERILRTSIVDAKKLYVVVSYSVVVNRDRDVQVAECIVNL